MSGTLRCPGCDRSLRAREIASDGGFARCTSCDTVFVPPEDGRLRVLAYRTGPVAKPRGIERRFVARSASGGGYRDAGAGHAELTLRWSTRLPRTVFLVLAILSAAGAAIAGFAVDEKPLYAAFYPIISAIAFLVAWFFAPSAKETDRAIEVRDERLTTRGPASISLDAADVRDIRVVRKVLLSEQPPFTQERPRPGVMHEVIARAAGRSVTIASYLSAHYALYIASELRMALGIEASAQDRIRVAVPGAETRAEPASPTDVDTETGRDAEIEAEAAAAAEADAPRAARTNQGAR